MSRATVGRAAAGPCREPLPTNPTTTAHYQVGLQHLCSVPTNLATTNLATTNLATTAYYQVGSLGPAARRLLYLPYISPTSPLHLPHISPISPYQVGASAQLLGAFCFNVACVYGLPHMTSTHLQAAA